MRRAWRSSQRLDAELDVLVLRRPESEPSATERERLESLRRIASVLGAHLIVETAEDQAETAARIARERGTTYLLVGAPPPRRGLAKLSESLPMRIVRALPEVDVRIVADRLAAARR